MGRYFNSAEFTQAFLKDIQKVDVRLIIYSAFMTQNRVNFWIPYFEELIAAGKKIIVVTKPYDEQTTNMQNSWRAAQDSLIKIGVVIVLKRSMHEKIAIIDDKIAWTGSLNILSYTGDTGEEMQFTENDDDIKELLLKYDVSQIENAVKNTGSQIINLPLYYSASYSAYLPDFLIASLPAIPEKRELMQTSFSCVLRNILARSRVIKPSCRIRKYDEAYPEEHLTEPKKLSEIMRFQFAILALLENGMIHISDTEWSLQCDAPILLDCAADDLLEWFELLYTLKGERFERPEVCINEKENAIKIRNSFETYHFTQDLFDGVAIYSAEIPGEMDYYRVSCAEQINYEIESDISQEKRCALLGVLTKIFPQFQGFKPGQERIVISLLNRKKTIGVLPTGGGKSICYQLAALLQPGGTICVSPLVSLMTDQKLNLDKNGFDRTEKISSEQKPAEKAKIIGRFGANCYQLIWVSPERFQSESFRESLQKMDFISYAILDEVHCLSEWGHDFRTSYLNLVNTISHYCPHAVLGGLTATASQAVLTNLKIEFGAFGEPASVCAVESLDRDNLKMRVGRVSNKRAALEHLLMQTKRFKKGETGIVFSARRDKTDDPDRKSKSFALLEKIREVRPDLVCAKYHAGMKNKAEIQQRFVDGEIDLLSSTKAFGMGIDKKDVRYTIHYGLPWSIESFYQEAGRAGRDDKRAECIILYTPEDDSLKNATDKLFEKDTSVEEIVFINKINKDYMEDLNTLFYLWTQNKTGVLSDYHMTSRVMNALLHGGQSQDMQGNTCCWLRVPDGEDDKNDQQAEAYQLAIYRLSILGLVKDWTVEWTWPRAFNCTINTEWNAEEAWKNLIAYIKPYDPLFLDANTGEPAEYHDIYQDENKSMHEKCIMLLIQWTYDNILYSSRQMIRNMKKLCDEYQNPDQFREEINRFLRITDASAVLEGIVENPQETDSWLGIFEEPDVKDATRTKKFRTMESCRNLYAETSRFMESFRNITGLNLVYCLSGALLGRYDQKEDHKLMLQVAGDLEKRYKETEPSFLLELEAFFDAHMVSNGDGPVFQQEALQDMVDCLVLAFPNRARTYYKKYRSQNAMKIILRDAAGKLAEINGGINK